MKKTTVLSLLFCLGSYVGLGQSLLEITHWSDVFDDERRILVSLPVEYFDEPDRKFDVIYVFDAQNRAIFDLVHSTYPFVGGYMVPAIVVGVVSESRNYEMLPAARHESTLEFFGEYQGGADLFAEYLSSELIPFMEKRFSAGSFRAGVGHSNGGTFLFHCLSEHPDIFDAYITVSPALGYDEYAVIERMEENLTGDFDNMKFVYASGANEGGTWIAAREKSSQLLNRLAGEINIRYVEESFPHADHTATVPPGIYNGLLTYVQHVFFNPDFLSGYLDKCGTENILGPEILNYIAYRFHNGGDTDRAVGILHYAAERYPNEPNLYDSLGEMYEESGDIPNAVKYYRLFGEVLEAESGNMEQYESERLNELYEQKKLFIEKHEQ